jgi:predicted  nucleic acid-binding Zn-ribbon protein
MNAVSVPFLPLGLWLFATAGCILILVLVFGMFWYWRQRFQSALIDSRHVAELASRKEQLQADVTELRNWITEQKNELLRLKSDREEQEQIGKEITRLQDECANAEYRIIEFRKEIGEQESQHHSLSQAVDRLFKETEELQSQKQKFDDLSEKITEAHKNLSDTDEKLTSIRKDFELLTRQIADRRIVLNALNSSHENLSEKIKKDTAESDQLSTTLNRKDEELKEKRSLSEDIRHQADTLTRQTAERRIELDTMQIKHEYLSNKIEEMTEESKRLTILSQELNIRIQPLKDDCTRLDQERNHLVKENESHKEDIRNRKEQIVDLEKQKTELIAKLSISGGQDGNPGAYADLLQEPQCLKETNLPRNKFPDDDEEHALNKVQICLENAGYQFHERVINSFHKALKCQDINPLTVLAGVSGTGKTLLPTAYAQLKGMHSLVIAVQPRWDSPQDMFGFYNYLENRYKATDLARALIRMNPSNNIEGLDENQKVKDRMLLILLDEMNLARTEYYFSEFLSKLELRNLSDKIERQHSEITLDTGPGRKMSFWVKRNVLFAGTMNEDETTQTLSDKVLDRANILRFGKPAKRNAQGQPKKLPDPPGYLMLSQWMDWCRPVDAGQRAYMVQEWIDGLNNALTKVGRPFGHRVQLSMQTYVSNYPGVNGDNVYKIAFADQIEQKILPKLRGLDIGGMNNTALEEIGRIIEKTGDQALLKAFDDALQNNTSGMFIWQGVTR